MGTNGICDDGYWSIPGSWAETYFRLRLSWTAGRSAQPDSENLI